MRKNKKKLGPITIILIIMLAIMGLTSILALIGFEGQKTIIASNKLETYLITVKNIFSFEGIKYFFSSAFTNYANFKPMIYLVFALISVGVAEASGLIKEIADKFKRLKFKYLTMLVMVLSLVFIFIGDYSFVILIPFVASVYKSLGKNPILGIITVFTALTLGYGLGFFYNYSEYYLGTLTQIAAQLDVDKGYTFNALSNIYITIFTTIVLILFASNIISEKIALKFNNPEITDLHINISKQAKEHTIGILFMMLMVLAYLIIPGSNYAGFLLDKNEAAYMAQLFGPNSPFGLGLPYIIMIMFMICGLVYGKKSENIKDSHCYNECLSSSFSKMGYTFVLMFFISQLIGILNWTNIGEVIVANILTFMSHIEFSGLPLIFMIFVIVVLVSIIIPSISDKWVLMSPVIVPLLMRSNITPNMTQLTIELADGVGKMMTPLFPYYIIMLGFICKYKEKNEITLFETIKLLMPLTLMMAGIYLLIILCWFIIGLPLGVGTFPSL